MTIPGAQPPGGWGAGGSIIRIQIWQYIPEAECVNTTRRQDLTYLIRERLP